MPDIAFEPRFQVLKLRPVGVQPDAEKAEKENQHWERWAKKRTFVRALEGTYSHLYKQLVDQPRVFSSKDVPWKGGPGHFGKSVISPQAVNITQSIESPSVEVSVLSRRRLVRTLQL